MNHYYLRTINFSPWNGLNVQFMSFTTRFVCHGRNLNRRNNLVQNSHLLRKKKKLRRKTNSICKWYFKQTTQIYFASLFREMKFQISSRLLYRFRWQFLSALLFMNFPHLVHLLSSPFSFHLTSVSVFYSIYITKMKILHSNLFIQRGFLLNAGEFPRKWYEIFLFDSCPMRYILWMVCINVCARGRK